MITQSQLASYLHLSSTAKEILSHPNGPPYHFVTPRIVVAHQPSSLLRILHLVVFHFFRIYIFSALVWNYLRIHYIVGEKLEERVRRWAYLMLIVLCGKAVKLKARPLNFIAKLIKFSELYCRSHKGKATVFMQVSPPIVGLLLVLI